MLPIWGTYIKEQEGACVNKHCTLVIRHSLSMTLFSSGREFMAARNWLLALHKLTCIYKLCDLHVYFSFWFTIYMFTFNTVRLEILLLFCWKRYCMLMLYCYLLKFLCVELLWGEHPHRWWCSRKVLYSYKTVWLSVKSM